MSTPEPLLVAKHRLVAVILLSGVLGAIVGMLVASVLINVEAPQLTSTVQIEDRRYDCIDTSRAVWCERLAD